MNSDTWYANGRATTINDLTVFYKRSGKGQTLICIHGFPSSSWDSEPIWPSLIKRFDVITHDLIGLGKSAKPNKRLSISLQADIIEGLALKEGVKEAHLLAHDIGDTIAQELLARQYQKTSKINWLSCVFLNGGIFPETHHALLIQNLLLSKLDPLVSKFMSQKSLKRSFNSVFSKSHPPTDEFIQETWKLICANKGKSMIPKLIQYMAERRAFRARWVEPLIKKIVPIRLINGIEDPISGKHAADRFTEIVPNADVIYLEKSGHYLHIETPGEVLNAFFEFHQLIAQNKTV